MKTSWPKEKLAEGFRYGILGILTYFFSLGAMFVFADLLKQDELLSYALTQSFVVLSNFFAARHWVFRVSDRDLTRQFTRFLASSIFFRFLNWSVYALLWLLAEVPRESGVLIALVVIFPVKYWVHRSMVFLRPS